jgi:glycosyltransferase involved in cell wall biosynthesis
LAEPRLLVFSSLFPSPVRPHAGVFIRERMFRVARQLPLVVVSPQPWFPGQGLIRCLRPGYRPAAPRHEQQRGIDVYRPRFLAIPGILRWLDGISMALCSYFTVRRLQRRHAIQLLDAHFAYPDGDAAVHLGRWLDLPVTVTLRGTEVPHSRQLRLRSRIARTLQSASRVFSVSDSLRQLALSLGVPAERTEVVGNGVDLACFHAVDRREARKQLGLPQNAKVLISVGALVERKGIHRVLDCLPALLIDQPDLHYLVVGGANPEGDMSAELQRQAAAPGLRDHVHFLGALPPESLKWPLSAADVFVLSTRNEGWANVFLEAMACGLPVVTTDVGGNAEVVCRPELGTIVAFDDAPALLAALEDALGKKWDRDAILAYAFENQWDKRIAQLLRAFDEIMVQARLRTSGVEAIGQR